MKRRGRQMSAAVNNRKKEKSDVYGEEREGEKNLFFATLERKQFCSSRWRKRKKRGESTPKVQ